MDELLMKLKQEIKDELLEELQQEESSQIVITLSEACVLVGVSRQTLIQTFIDYEREVGSFVKFSDGRSHWKIAYAPFKKWYTENFAKVA